MKVTQSCPTLCNPIDYTVHGLFQTRILEWVAFPFSRVSSQPRDQTQGSNPGLPHCRQILYQLNHKGSPVNTLNLNLKNISHRILSETGKRMIKKSSHKNKNAEVRILMSSKKLFSLSFSFRADSFTFKKLAPSFSNYILHRLPV